MMDKKGMSNGVREATGSILDALEDAGIETGEELMAIIYTDIQRLAVAPVEAERDKALADYRAEVDLCTDRTIERDEARAELDRMSAEVDRVYGEFDTAQKRVRQEEREACALLAERSRTGPPCPFDAPADRTPPVDKPCPLCGQDSSGQGGHMMCVAFHEGAKLAAAIRNRSTEGEG